MRVLVLGADGFVGRHIAFGLRSAGHDVIASARRTSRLEQMGFQTLKADLLDPKSHSSHFWSAHVESVTHVVNAAGLLNAGKAAMEAVHLKAPRALYEALPDDAKILLISAISIDEGNSLFATTRIKGEKLVHQFDGIALRPGLVLADTSYGGSSLARALAALPWITPLIEGGAQKMNPIHASDLTEVIIELMQRPKAAETFEIGGAETITQAEMLSGYRKWLGLGAARQLNIPRGVAGMMGKTGDLLNLGPISSTFLSMMDAGAVAKTSPQIQTKPRGFSDFLWKRPAGTQDIWQAHLYFPALLARLVLALMWLASGLIGLLYPVDGLVALGVAENLGATQALLLARGGGCIDLLIGWAVFRGWRPMLWGWVQLGMVAGYTLGLTVLDPALWGLPFGGLLKNLPILVLILFHMTLSDER